MPEIAWGKKIGGPFKSKVIAICTDLQCDPSHLTSAMAFETAESFRPDIVNPASGATGLIQFLPSTARSLGTTTQELASMSAIDQLDFVKKHLNPFKRKMKTLSDVYMTILLPSAVGKAEASVLFSHPSTAYLRNKRLDVNKDGQITKGEAAGKVQTKLERGLEASRRG